MIEKLLTPMVKFILRSSPRGADLPKPITENYCHNPFKSLSIDLRGDCFVCDCGGWLPIPVGNILDFADLKDVWTNDIARELQQDVVDQKFTYCAVKNCEILQSSIRKSKYHISVGIDDSCNLACPSCRREAVNHTSGEIFDITKQRVNHFVKLLSDFNEPMHIVLCSNGDVLASSTMRPLVLDWQPKDNQTIKLFTNGLLMKKLLPDSKILPHVSEFDISVDAGSSEVYQTVRRPGKFDILLENLQWLADNKPPKSTVTLIFCLSSMNVNDVVSFVSLCERFNFDGRIKKIENWNTFDNFSDYDILGNSAHPMYNSAIQQLALVKDNPLITLSAYINNLLKTV
jgi:MoaA/NifB/PqqE/SkfB family radical SAM enzyme